MISVSMRKLTLNTISFATTVFTVIFFAMGPSYWGFQTKEYDPSPREAVYSAALGTIVPPLKSIGEWVNYFSYIYKGN